MNLSKVELEEIQAHFPTVISKEVADYATNVALKRSRYIFTKRSGSGQQYGYCTHCKKQSKTDDLKHNTQTICRNCISTCIVKASGRGRKYLQDEAYFVWYERSLLNSQAITARGIHVRRDYSGNYLQVETVHRVTAMYVFEPGQSRMIDRYGWNGNHWKERKSIISEGSTTMQNVACYCSHESIGAAVKNTPFQYSTWETYLNGDMLKFFDLASKYACVEYLTKLGFTHIVKSKLLGHRTFNAINWRGKTINKVLRMTKQELRDVRESGLTPTPYTLYIFQQSKKDKSNFTFEEARKFSGFIHSQYSDDLKILQKYTSLRKILSYIEKQLLKKNAKKHFLGGYQVLTTWRDYVADCRTLGLDLSKEAVLFPSNLYRAHQNTIKQVKVKEDEELNKKITLRVATLEKFSFQALGYILRPAVNSKELIEEGKALQHCVGTYAEKYAKGTTDLFVIRKLEEPDKPFYTMEIKGGNITQTRGMKNCLPTKEVQSFVDRFISEKLEEKKPKFNKRQEVAV